MMTETSRFGRPRRHVSLWLFGCSIYFGLIAGCGTPPGVLIVKRHDLAQYLSRNGVAASPATNYWQDARGQAVFVFGGQGALVSADQNRPQVLADPLKNQALAREYWFDRTGQVRYLPAFAYNEYDADIWTDIDPQSGYFCQGSRKDNVAHVGHMELGGGWIFSVTGTDQFSADQICARGDVIYLLDHRDRAMPAFLHTRANCWAFAKDPKLGGQYVKVDEFSVPGWVRNVDPFSPRFFCQGYGYMPFPGRPFLYDTQAHRTMRTFSSDDVVLFLDGDWLANRLK